MNTGSFRMKLPVFFTPAETIFSFAAEAKSVWQRDAYRTGVPERIVGREAVLAANGRRGIGPLLRIEAEPDAVRYSLGRSM